MHHEQRWSRQSHRLTMLLLAVTIVPAATLIWLGVELLQRDRSLAAQREQEWRTSVAEAIVRALDRALEAAFEAGSVPAGMARFDLSAAGVQVTPRDGVLWLAGAPPLVPAEDARFEEAERLEFHGEPDRAAAAYANGARSPEATVRAGALVRLARVQRRQRRWDAAIAAYRELAAIDDVAVAGAPADLQARRALCEVLDEAGRTADARRETAALETDFVSGRWMLDHSAWQLTASEIRQRTGRRVSVAPGRELLSFAADGLGDIWRNDARTSTASSGRRVVPTKAAPVTMIWRGDGRRATVLVIVPATLDALVREASRGVAGTRVALLTVSGALVAGLPSGHIGVVKMPAADTGLPWNVQVSIDGPSPLAGEFAGRRRLLLVGLTAILLLAAGGGYVLWRVLQRELAISRLQTDFVAAVSHEFRTPLTSLRHVTELLDESDDLPADRRKGFYASLARSTERLHRLVESLLDFSRMEGGKKPYDLRLLDAGWMVSQVVTDFQREVEPRGVAVTLDVEQSSLAINADAQSMTYAIWNLLDNAVKYSPDGGAVAVSIRRRGADVAISVCDRGIGIPPRERKEIFRRFVRGAQATRLGIKGTGLGLAMVSHIVQAHGGAIELESHEGAGSTFTLVLPSGETPFTFVTSAERDVSVPLTPGRR
jgi:signal transduction histidine kinase